MERKEYFVSKKKAKKSVMIFSIILAGVLATYGFVLFTGEGDMMVVHIVYGIIIALFAMGLISILVKMNDKKPGLIISDEGVVDNMSGAKDYVHPWSTIEKVSRKKMFARMHILVFIENPYQFIESQSGQTKRNLNARYGQAGTPVAIPVEFLEGDENIIFNEIRAQIRKHKGTDGSEENEAEA